MSRFHITSGLVLLISSILAGLSQQAGDTSASQSTHSDFSGDILAVFYVGDVRKSVDYYTETLGFRFDHFYDHHSGDSVNEWTYEDAPVYAEMWAGPTRFALHLAKTSYEKNVGGMIHYFRVKDVEARYKAVKSRGGNPSDLIDKPWMKMFSITDLDGHRIFFQTPPN